MAPWSQASFQKVLAEKRPPAGIMIAEPASKGASNPMSEQHSHAQLYQAVFDAVRRHVTSMQQNKAKVYQVLDRWPIAALQGWTIRR